VVSELDHVFTGVFEKQISGLAHPRLRLVNATLEFTQGANTLYACMWLAGASTLHSRRRCVRHG
jgi:hypothetical protein